jgi:hypothetical protein
MKYVGEVLDITGHKTGHETVLSNSASSRHWIQWIDSRYWTRGL